MSGDKHQWFLLEALTGDYLREYRELDLLIEEKLVEQTAKLHEDFKQHQAESAAAPPTTPAEDYGYDPEDWFFNEYRKLEQRYPQHVRHSMFVSLCAFLEQHLVSLCRHYEKSQALNLDDVNGKGIHKCRLYLEKVVGVAFPTTSPHWQLILKYNVLRNHLVHAGPTIRRNDDKTPKTLNQLPGVKADHHIVVDETFYKSALATVTAFIDELFTVLK